MHIYFNIRTTPSLNKKIDMQADIINMDRITLNMHKMVFYKWYFLEFNVLTYRV